MRAGFEAGVDQHRLELCRVRGLPHHVADGLLLLGGQRAVGPQSEPAGVGELRQALFGEGGHVGQELRALRRGDPQRLELARPDEGQGGGEAVEHQRHMAAHHIVEAGRGALVGHVRKACAGGLVQEKAGHMRHGARAVRGIAQAVLVGLAEGDHVLDILHRQIRRGHQHQAAACELDQRHDGLAGVVAHLDDVRDLADQRAHAEQQRVGIHGCLQQFIDGDDACAAGFGVDDEGMLGHARELVAECARHQVGGATGGPGDHDAYGLVGPLVGRTLLGKTVHPKAAKRERGGRAQNASPSQPVVFIHWGLLSSVVGNIGRTSSKCIDMQIEFFSLSASNFPFHAIK